VQRRHLMKLIAGLPLLPTATSAQTTMPAFSRVRPADADWPSDAQWQSLRAELGERLLRVQSPLEADSRTVIMRQSCKEAEAALAAR